MRQICMLSRFVLASAMVLAVSCGNDSEEEDSAEGNSCAGLSENACGGPLCVWNKTAGVCEAVEDAGDPLDAGIPADASTAVDAGWTPCPTDCSAPECGWALIDGQEECIVAPHCEGLDEGSCTARIGCTAIAGKRAPVTSESSYEYVGCSFLGGTPGATVACTAPGPSGPCWVVPNYCAPDGWDFWPCPTGYLTFEECMSGGPYASN